MLFYSDVEPQSVCQVIGPDRTHCLKIGSVQTVRRCGDGLLRRIALDCERRSEK